MSLFHFSHSMFLLSTLVFLLHPRFPKFCTCSLLSPSLFQHDSIVPQKGTLPPTFSRTLILFQTVRKIFICDTISELFFSFFHLDRTLTLAGLYTATRQSSSLLSLLVKTIEQVCDLNQLFQKKHWTAQVVPSVCPCSSPACVFTNKSNDTLPCLASPRLTLPCLALPCLALPL